jgi:2-dehydropantoate 2-reductase
MNILIIGTGGVGGYFGGKLALAGNKVIFVARGKHLEAIKEKGLVVKSLKGDFVIHPAIVTDNFSALAPPDLIILGVKAWQVKDIATEIKPILHDKTVILPLQNGVMVGEELSAVLGPKHVLGGLCRIFSKIEAPGVINHYGVDPEIVFGELNNEKTARILELQQNFVKSGFKATIPESIQTELWRKLILIGSGSLLALTRSSYGSVRENPETRTLMQNLLIEIYLVGKKSGARLEDDTVDKIMKYIDSYPYDSNTSLARDIWAEKPSEIEYQSGSVSVLGEKLGIQTPINTFIYHCLLPMERRAREKALGMK